MWLCVSVCVCVCVFMLPVTDIWWFSLIKLLVFLLPARKPVNALQGAKDCEWVCMCETHCVFFCVSQRGRETVVRLPHWKHFPWEKNYRCDRVWFLLSEFCLTLCDLRTQLTWKCEFLLDNATPSTSQTGYKLLIYVNIAFESIYLSMECQVITAVSDTSSASHSTLKHRQSWETTEKYRCSWRRTWWGFGKQLGFLSLGFVDLQNVEIII